MNQQGVLGPRAAGRYPPCLLTPQAGERSSSSTSSASFVSSVPIGAADAPFSPVAPAAFGTLLVWHSAFGACRPAPHPRGAGPCNSAGGIRGAPPCSYTSCTSSPPCSFLPEPVAYLQLFPVLRGGLRNLPTPPMIPPTVAGVATPMQARTALRLACLFEPWTPHVKAASEARAAWKQLLMGPTTASYDGLLERHPAAAPDPSGRVVLLTGAVFPR